MNVTLRPVTEADLPTFFAQQDDKRATDMAGVPGRAREAFFTHWRENVLPNPTSIVRSIEVDGALAGNVVSWVMNGERLVGYFLGHDHWGKGIASAALAQFLQVVKERPLFAFVSPTNEGSIRVLEKCGFVRVHEAPDDLKYELR